MFCDCYVVFRQARRKHRRTDGTHYTGVELQPVMAFEDAAEARRFKDSVEEETGLPAPVARVRMWRRSHG